jgi:hypothetical protein
VAGWDRRARVALVAALVLLLAAVGAPLALALHRTPPPKPTSVQLNLRDRQQEVRLDQMLVFRASRPIALAALRAALTITPALDGTLTASSSRATAFTWTPSAPWTELTLYTISLRSIRDAGGRPVQARHWRFTTTLVPRVLSLTTGTGAAVSDAAWLPAGTPLQLTFNTAMDTGSVGLLANQGPLGLTWGADGRSAALDVGPLHVGPVELALAPGGRSSGGRPLAPWRLALTLAYQVQVHTVLLQAPALVQVPNDPAARDQSGLQAAAMVYEYLTEGGISRFTAIYMGAPDAIGPVRSGRLISFALTRHYRGGLFASGLSAGSAGRLNADPVPHLFDTPGVYYRTRDRFVPDNLFISGASVQGVMAQSGVAPFALPAASLPAGSGPEAPTVSVPEHQSTYQYDAATGTYTKQVGPRTLADAATGQPLRIQLLIVMHTTATRTDYAEDVNGQPGLDFDMESGGRAELYVDGRQLAGHWSSPDRTSPLRFELEGGGVVNPPPLTWVDVVTG